jgi:hypothetical protein
MRKRTSCVLGFLIVFVFGLSTVLWADSGFCPIPSAEYEAISDLPQEEVGALRENYSIPRNQVLLEIGTGTW